MKTHPRLLAFVLVITLLAACTPVLTPTAMPTATFTPPPTVTPSPTVTPTEAVMPTMTATVEVMPVVNLNPEIYTVEVTLMPEVDRRAFEMAPDEYNRGIKAYSLRLRRVVYVNQENYVVGIFNTEEKHIANEYGDYFEGVQPATGFENMMIVIMGKSNEQFVLVSDYKDRTMLDKEGPEKLSSAMRAALASVHLYQKNKTSMPDKSTEWQTWTRGEGADLFAKDSNAIARFDAGVVKLSDPIIIVTGLDGEDEMADKEAVITVDSNGFLFIGFNTVVDSSPYVRAYISYLTLPRSYFRYCKMLGADSFPWKIKVSIFSVSYLHPGSVDADTILIQRDIIGL